MNRLHDIIKQIIDKVHKNEEFEELEIEFNKEILRKTYPTIAIMSLVGFSTGFLLGRFFKHL